MPEGLQNLISILLAAKNIGITIYIVFSSAFGTTSAEIKSVRSMIFKLDLVVSLCLGFTLVELTAGSTSNILAEGCFHFFVLHLFTNATNFSSNINIGRPRCILETFEISEPSSRRREYRSHMPQIGVRLIECSESVKNAGSTWY